MSGNIIGFDHALVGVQDLEASWETWKNLGFTLCPRGKHIGWGTANYCIMFPDDYIELLGIVDASQFVNNLDVFLEEHGEGLLGMAFASDDIPKLAERLDGEPQDLKRLLELPEGTVEPRFKLVHPPKGTLPGLSGFFCQHLTPELMRQPDWLSHPNSARRIAAITVAVDDMDAAIGAYGNVFGADKIHQDGDEAEVMTGIGQIYLVPASDEAGLIRLTIEVYDLRATAAYFIDTGIDFRHSAKGLSVDPKEANGANVTFI